MVNRACSLTSKRIKKTLQSLGCFLFFCFFVFFAFLFFCFVLFFCFFHGLNHFAQPLKARKKLVVDSGWENGVCYTQLLQAPFSIVLLVCSAAGSFVLSAELHVHGSHRTVVQFHFYELVTLLLTPRACISCSCVEFIGSSVATDTF